MKLICLISQSTVLLGPDWLTFEMYQLFKILVCWSKTILKVSQLRPNLNALIIYFAVQTSQLSTHQLLCLSNILYVHPYPLNFPLNLIWLRAYLYNLRLPILHLINVTLQVNHLIGQLWDLPSEFLLRLASYTTERRPGIICVLELCQLLVDLTRTSFHILF